MAVASFGVKSVIGEAWKVLTLRWKTIGLFSLVLFGIMFASGIIEAIITNLEIVFLDLLWSAASLVLNIYLGVVVIYVFLKIVRGVSFSMNEIWFKDKGAMIQYFVATLVVGALTMVGLLLFIIPGIIIALMLSQAPTLTIDKGLKWREALSESRRMTRGYKGKMLWIQFVFGLMNLAGMLLLGLGLIITIPLTMLSSYVIYKQLLGETSGGVTPTPIIPAMPAPAMAETTVTGVAGVNPTTPSNPTTPPSTLS